MLAGNQAAAYLLSGQAGSFGDNGRDRSRRIFAANGVACAQLLMG